ncbi:MAG TPA: TIGR03067 domain-containing protein [Gemmata sp.]|nr:TIGR03067 domain-containing protein [Gemmata sp.]
MKTIAAFALGLGMLASLGGTSSAQDKKAPKIEGKYTLVGGKVNGNPVSDESKKAEYSADAEKFVIKGKEFTFEMSYKIDASAEPMKIDMVILEGPEGSKGSKAQGIVELKGDTLKLAYTMEKDKRPKDFKGESDYLFELKKAK